MKRAFEEDFPRGGGGGGGAAANDEAPRRAKKRVLALPRLDLEARHGVRCSAPRRGSGAARCLLTQSPRAALQDDGGPGVSGKVPTFVEQLKYKARARAAPRRGSLRGVRASAAAAAAERFRPRPARRRA